MYIKDIYKDINKRMNYNLKRYSVILDNWICIVYIIKKICYILYIYCMVIVYNKMNILNVYLWKFWLFLI